MLTAYEDSSKKFLQRGGGTVTKIDGAKMLHTNFSSDNFFKKYFLIKTMST